MTERIGRILLSEDVILQRVRDLGQQISNDYRGKKITIVCVLKGAVIFLADLLRNLDMPVTLDFVQVLSYGDKTESSGEIKILQALTTDIKGRDVLVVDDIIDSGLTLCHLKEYLLIRRPASIKFCVLLKKVRRRIQALENPRLLLSGERVPGASAPREDVKADYIGFQIPNTFVIGYGLDYAEHYRGLRYIAELKSLN